MRVVGLCVLLMICGYSVVSAGPYPSSITERQRELLRIAHEEGAVFGFPETMQSILWQETLAGEFLKGDYGIVGDDKDSEGLLKPLGKKSYGVMQIRLVTAQDVLRRFAHLGVFGSEEELLVALITNDRFNIKVAAHFFKMQMNDQRLNKDWKKAVLAYNVGASNVVKYGLAHDPNQYLAGVTKHLADFVRRVNRGKIMVRQVDNEKTDRIATK